MKQPAERLGNIAPAHSVIIRTIFVESRAWQLDLEQIYGNGLAMGQKVSYTSICIINAS
jgi:hypothetical protein